MSHFAKVNGFGVVEEVIVAEQDFIDSLPNASSWVQTSYNTFGGAHKLGGTPFRKNFAGIGFTYDPVRGAFIPPKPFASWSLNEETCLWEPPTPMPLDGSIYYWDEPTTSWIKDAE